MKIILWTLVIAGVLLKSQVAADTKYEAEIATLSGGANISTNHTGYSGSGFVDGFLNNITAQVSFAITGATGGSYTLTLHYSAGNGASTNTGLYVNGTKIKNITCNGTANWDTWTDEVETVTLNVGNNTIAYKADIASNSCINIDYINLNVLPNPCAGVQGGGGGLIGASFGLNPPYVAGSEYCKATDGDINTSYDYSLANGGFTGLDFGISKVITKIRYYPRSTFVNRMVNGKFQGSNDGVTFIDLYTISTAPPVQWNEVTITNSTGYRYVRYLSPNSGFGNIAEMEFYQNPSTYSLSISSDGHGTTSPTGTITVNSGVATPISATTSAGYLFSDWTVTSGTATIAASTSSSTTVTLSSGNATIQAHFTAHAPTDITLSPSSIAEHLPANTVVGTFSAQDVDFGSTFTFSLVSGTGSIDNGSFGVINGNQLVTTASFDYLTKNSYSIRIRVNDNIGQTFEKQLTVTVTYGGTYADPVMTPSPGSELLGTTQAISWTAVTGALNYKLDLGTGVGLNDLYSGTAGPARNVTVSGLPGNGSTIYVRLTTVDPSGSHVYDFTYIAYADRPKALNVDISGSLQVGQVINGTYTYFDTDPEGATSYKWYRANDVSGAGKTAISGATSITYMVMDADAGKYLLFEVTPRATTGIIDGLPTLSPVTGPVDEEYVYPKVCGANQNMKVDGKVKIGAVTNPTEMLEVAGNIKAEEIIARKITATELVATPKWKMPPPDYVFAPGYKLETLSEMEQYLKTNGHLKDIPSAEEMIKNGVPLVELNMLLLKKIEELTLHTIELNKVLDQQALKINSLEKIQHGTEENTK